MANKLLEIAKKKENSKFNSHGRFENVTWDELEVTLEFFKGTIGNSAFIEAIKGTTSAYPTAACILRNAIRLGMVKAIIINKNEDGQPK